MRLWAALDTITFGEYGARQRDVVETSIRLRPSYVGPIRTPSKRPRWPIDLSALGDAAIVQVPELGRTFTALTGLIERGDEEASRAVWLVESALRVRLGTMLKGTLGTLDEMVERGERPACQALGELSIAGRELKMRGDALHPVRVLRFQSLCLRAGDPRFGQWVGVERYGELVSDPDVVGAPVLVAEIEVLL